MDSVTIRRSYTQPPSEVWPVIADPKRWLERGGRWMTDDDGTEPGEVFAGRLWDGTGPSTQVTVTLTESDEGGTDVTVEEVKDREFVIEHGENSGVSDSEVIDRQPSAQVRARVLVGV